MPIPRDRATYTPYEDRFDDLTMEELGNNVVEQIRALNPQIDIRTGIIGGKFRLGVSMQGIRRFQRGNKVLDEMTLDLVPGPRTNFGLTVGMSYPSGWTKIFGAEILEKAGGRMELVPPITAFARYIAGAFEIKNAQQSIGDIKNIFERLGTPEMRDRLPPHRQVAGSLQMYA